MSISLRTLKGVGEKTEKLFAKIGVTDMESLLSYYPRGGYNGCVCESGAESSGDHDHCGRSYGENFCYVV